MSVFLGGQLLAGVATNTIYNAHNLFDFKWADHELEDQNWLRADTFSWQDGTVYSEAYNHLLSDYDNAPERTIQGYGWYDSVTGYVLLTSNSTPSVGDYVYCDLADPGDPPSYYVVGTVSALSGTTLTTTSSGMIILSGTATRNSSYDTNISIKYYSETIGSYTINYCLAADGHKIILPDQETTAANIYNESGVAWYYILDTANQRFKLPRELPPTDRIKGNGKTLGLTNGSTNVGLSAYQLVEANKDMFFQNAYNVNTSSTAVTGTGTNGLFGVTTDQTKSGMVIHRANSNGQQYLYFYVGQFSQSATEQTAGLNAELFNGKVDLDLGNIDNTNNQASGALNTAGIRTVVDTYSNGYNWYRIWSDGWVEQGGRINAPISSPFVGNVNLLKTMADTNYTILITGSGPNSGQGYYTFYIYSSSAKTTSGFYVSLGSNTSVDLYWDVRGFKG